MVAAALDLLLSEGYGSTAVDRICERAGVSKGSFYHFFKSKEDLGLAALEDYFRQGVLEIGSGAYRSLTDPVERGLGYLDHVESVAKTHWAQGCLLGTFAVDLGERHPRIRRRVGEMFDEIAADIANMLAPFGDPAGESALTPKELAEQFLVTLEGGIVMARAHDDLERIPEAIRRFRRCVLAKSTA